MKKILLLLLVSFVSTGLFATTYYWTGTHWSLTSGGAADGTAPSSTTYGDDFIIEDTGYEVAIGTSVVARDFTVNDGGFSLIYFSIAGHINIGGKFETISTSGVNGAACLIKAGGYLELSSNTIPSVVPRPIIYDDITSKMSVYKLDQTSGLASIYPAKGLLELKQGSYTYNFGNQDMIIDNTRAIDVLASDVTIESNSLIISRSIVVDPTAQNVSFSIYGNITISSGYTFTVSTTGVNLSSSTGRVIVEPGAKIATNNNSGTINKLTLDGSSTSQGVIVGTGFVCNDVNMTVVPNWSRGDASWGNYAWREFGSPFAKSIYSSDVTWGGSNEANINGNDGADVNPGNGGGSDSYINYWDASAQLWKVPSSTGTGSGAGPYTSVVNFNNAFETWYEADGTNAITITGGDLSIHNSDYSVALGSIDNWLLIPNPYASFLDLYEVDNGLGRDYTGVMSILTYGNGGYSYKTFDYRGNGTFGADGMNKSSIPPFQAFWIQSDYNGNSGFSVSAQVDWANGSSISKRNSRYIPPYIDLSLKNVDGNVQEHMSLSFVDNIDYTPEEFNAINMNGLGDMATMYIPNLNGDRIYEGYDISVLEGGNYSTNLEMIGNIDGTYVISLSGVAIDPSYNVYLVDKQEDVTHLLNNGDYSFTHLNTDNSARFEIRITTETLGESEKIESASIKLINKGNSIEFVMPNTSAIETVQFVSINGQISKTVQAYNGQTEFDVTSLKSGVYIAQLKLESGNVASYKFVK